MECRIGILLERRDEIGISFQHASVAMTSTETETPNESA